MTPSDRGTAAEGPRPGPFLRLPGRRPGPGGKGRDERASLPDRANLPRPGPAEGRDPRDAEGRAGSPSPCPGPVSRLLSDGAGPPRASPFDVERSAQRRSRRHPNPGRTRVPSRQGDRPGFGRPRFHARARARQGAGDRDRGAQLLHRLLLHRPPPVDEEREAQPPQRGAPRRRRSGRAGHGAGHLGALLRRRPPESEARLRREHESVPGLPRLHAGPRPRVHGGGRRGLRVHGRGARAAAEVPVPAGSRRGGARVGAHRPPAAAALREAPAADAAGARGLGGSRETPGHLGPREDAAS